LQKCFENIPLEKQTTLGIIINYVCKFVINNARNMGREIHLLNVVFTLRMDVIVLLNSVSIVRNFSQ